jgi:hypothetical protein
MAPRRKFTSPRTGVSRQEARRAGVPNHQHMTSGEAPMVSAPITPDHFPTPHLALRAGVSETVRGFAFEQAAAALDIHQWLTSVSGLYRTEGTRAAAVRIAYAQATAWRYDLAHQGAIVGGTAAVDGCDARRFRTEITDDSPNLDRIGIVGRFRDGAEWDPDTRTYVGGVGTPASRITAAYGAVARARFAIERVSTDVLVNAVTLPDGSTQDGNWLIRGQVARDAGVELADRVAARGLDASRMEVGGDPIYAVTADRVDRDRIRDAMITLLASDDLDLTGWWQAVYLAYQSPRYKKGSDAAHRVFLAAVAAWRLGHCPVIPQDIDLRCMVLGQTAATLPLICGGAHR